MPSLQLRPAVGADVPAVVALLDTAYRGPGGWTTEAGLIDGPRTSVADVEHALPDLLVAEQDGEVVACCQLRTGGDVAWLGMVAVRPDRQGGGLGRAVVEEAARRAHGCRELRLSVVDRRRELIDWYRRLGFRDTGEREPWPYGDDRFGRPRVTDLGFVVLARPR
ncbi:MAG TPA: GNAT family N-acetyltransferase [Acidimicrobiales bacterium]|nr:GNAT family N-acetyltransferase [Acidimicrobiales bacterium]